MTDDIPDHEPDREMVMRVLRELTPLVCERRREAVNVALRNVR